jgi:hypothetical protein
MNAIQRLYLELQHGRGGLEARGAASEREVERFLVDFKVSMASGTWSSCEREVLTGKA